MHTRVQIHMYTRACVCMQEKIREKEKICALAFSSSPFSVVGSEKGAVDKQHRALLEPKFQYCF